VQAAREQAQRALPQLADAQARDEPGQEQARV